MAAFSSSIASAPVPIFGEWGLGRFEWCQAADNAPRGGGK